MARVSSRPTQRAAGACDARVCRVSASDVGTAFTLAYMRHRQSSARLPSRAYPSRPATALRTFCTATGRNHWRPEPFSSHKTGSHPITGHGRGNVPGVQLVVSAGGEASARGRCCCFPEDVHFDRARASGTCMCRMSPCSHVCAAMPSMQLAMLAAFSLRMQRACCLKRFLVAACPAG